MRVGSDPTTDTLRRLRPSGHKHPVTMAAEVTRSISRRYVDPLTLVWERLLQELGMSLTRTADAYATYDGQGHLALAIDAHLDADDCVAQMVLHELCHALVQGRRALTTLDWNLPCGENEGLSAEFAAQRLQAYFADGVGMREFFAVTTQWRPYWDAMGKPLPASSNAESTETTAHVALARTGLENAKAWGWEGPLLRALDSTAAIAEAVGPWLGGDGDALWVGATGRHPKTRFPYAPTTSSNNCGDCAWATSNGPDGAPAAGNVYCLQAEVVVGMSDRACSRFEPPLSEDACATCGACCREAFDEVEVADDDALWKAPDDLRAAVTTTTSDTASPRHALCRPEGRCPLLGGDGAGATPYRCTAYTWRPESCRDFALGSRNCLFARQRVGLSRTD